MRTAGKIFFVFTLICGLFSNKIKSQDIHFSQFYESSILLNPAAAGAGAADYRLAINYKNQWKSLINPFQTAAIAFDTKLKKNEKHNYFGVGASIFNDKAGISKLVTNQLNINLAYHAKLSEKNMLSFGIQSGLFQKYINTGALRWDSQYDGRDYSASRPSGEQMTNSNYNQLDVGTGILFSHRVNNALSWQAGAAAAHLNRPHNTFYSKDENMNLKYTGHFHLQIRPAEKNYMILPALLFVQQGAHQEITGGSNIAFLLGKPDSLSRSSQAIHFGLFYRYRDAAVFVAALQLKNNMKFGLSYDFNLSRLGSVSNFRGGPEFSFVYSGFKKEKKKPVIVKDSIAPVVKTQTVEPEKPNVTSYKGTVSGSDKTVEAVISVTPLKDDGSEDTGAAKNTMSDESNGKYEMKLEAGKKYKIKITAPGFEPYEEVIDLTQQKKYSEEQRDFRLLPSKPVAVAENTVKPVQPTEKVSSCNGNPNPDVSRLKGRSFREHHTYTELMAVMGDYCGNGVVYKVQVAAMPTSKQIHFNSLHLESLGTIEVQSYPDGLSRFTMGSFETMNQAEVLRLKAVAAGQKDAWIIVFINGKRHTLEQLINKL